jgi:hypothetical protein
MMLFARSKFLSVHCSFHFSHYGSRLSRQKTADSAFARHRRLATFAAIRRTTHKFRASLFNDATCHELTRDFMSRLDVMALGLIA